jgi:hypothetical protein
MRLFRIRAHPDEMPRTSFLYNGIVEVTGSIPVGSTNQMKGSAWIASWALSVTKALQKPAA